MQFYKYIKGENNSNTKNHHIFKFLFSVKVITIVLGGFKCFAFYSKISIAILLQPRCRNIIRSRYTVITVSHSDMIILVLHALYNLNLTSNMLRFA